MNPVRPDRFARGLVEQEPGFWTSPAGGAVSYPDDGHERCAELEEVSFWFRHRNRCIVSLMDRVPPRGAVWDVGGGNGYVSAALRRAGHPTVLVEPGASGARNALARGLAPVVCATLEAADLEPGSLGAAGAFDVVEHVEDDVAFLRTLGRGLAPGAPLYLTVPALGWLWSTNDVRAGHYRRYSRRSLRRILEAAGLEVVALTYFFTPLVVPLFLARSLPSRLGLRGAPRAEVTRREHAPRGGIASRTLAKLLEWEGRALDRGASLPVGTSLLAAAWRPERS